MTSSNSKTLSSFLTPVPHPTPNFNLDNDEQPTINTPLLLRIGSNSLLSLNGSNTIPKSNNQNNNKNGMISESGNRHIVYQSCETITPMSSRVSFSYPSSNSMIEESFDDLNDDNTSDIIENLYYPTQYNHKSDDKKSDKSKFKFPVEPTNSVSRKEAENLRNYISSLQKSVLDNKIMPSTPHHGEYHLVNKNNIMSQNVNTNKNVINPNFMKKEYSDINKLNTNNIKISTSKNDTTFVPSGTSKLNEAVFNMMNSIVGGGIVGLPYVCSIVGLTGGVLLMLLFSYLSYYTLQLQIISAKMTKINTYENLCEYCFGSSGYYIVSFSMLIFDIGSTITYLIILADASVDIGRIFNFFGYEELFFRRIIIIVISCVIIFPICTFRDVSKIESFSKFSTYSVVLITFGVYCEFFSSYIISLNNNEINLHYGFKYTGFFNAVGIVAFSFMCHDCSFLIYNTLSNSTIKRWSKLSIYGEGGSAIICVFFSIGGYLSFGNEVTPNIMKNYPSKSIVIIIIRIVYIISMSLSYPTAFYVIRHVLYAINNRGYNYNSIINLSLFPFLVYYTIPPFLFTVIVALIIDNLGIVMGISGSLAAMNLAFILPTACFMKLSPYNIKNLFQLRNINFKKFYIVFKNTIPPLLVFIFGISIGIVSTITQIIQ